MGLEDFRVTHHPFAARPFFTLMGNHWDRSGIVTALHRFARPGRDWIHHKSLASAVKPVSHRSGTVTTLPTMTAQVSWPLCLASLGLGGIGFTMKVWQALLDRSVIAQVSSPLYFSIFKLIFILHYPHGVQFWWFSRIKRRLVLLRPQLLPYNGFRI